MFLVVMKITKARLPQKKILIPILAVVLIAASILSYYLYSNSKKDEGQIGMLPDTTINYDPPTDEELKDAAQQKEASITAYEKSLNDSSGETTITTFISRVFQDPSGVNIRAVIDGTTSGECIIKLSMSGQADITKSFSVVVNGTTYTCKDALIPIAEIPASGTWEVSLTINKDGGQSTPVTSSVEVTRS